MIKLKILFKNDNIDEHKLRNLMDESLFDIIQIFEHIEINSFPWRQSINLIKHINNESFLDFLGKKHDQIKKLIGDCIEENPSDLWLVLEDESNGEDLSQGSFIHSIYNWNQNIDEKSREHNMMKHFEMEKEHEWYNSYHFNKVINTSYSNNDVDFVFESTNKSDEEVSKVFRTNLLQQMRKHSETFLDTDTRMLAKGYLKTLK